VKSDELLDRVVLPGGSEMRLIRWDAHVAIEIDGRPLMSTHEHGSEDDLGRVVAERLAGIAAPRVLIGGLGLGFTLRAALDALPKAAEVVVAELVPDVVRWNRAKYGAYAGRPLRDRRVTVVVGDVGAAIAEGRDYDAIVLDVDNGPDALTHNVNANLYKPTALKRTRRALRPGGMLAVWSAFPSRAFSKVLAASGFGVELLRPPPTTEGGPRYYVWIGRKPAASRGSARAGVVRSARPTAARPSRAR